MDETEGDARPRNLLGKRPQLLELAPACVLYLALALSPVVNELREAWYTLCTAQPLVRLAVDLGDGQLVLHLGGKLCPDWCQLFAMTAPAPKRSVREGDKLHRGNIPRRVELDKDMAFVYSVSEGLVVQHEYLTVRVEIFHRHSRLVGFPLLLLLRLELNFRLGGCGNDWGSDRVFSSFGQGRQGGGLRVFGDIGSEKVIGAGLAIRL